MGSFDRGNRSSNGRGGFKKRSFGDRSFKGRDNSRPDMHKAICAQCGRSCEVPFRPTGDKPVYCSDCFENKRDDAGGNNRRYEERSYDRPSSSFGEKEMYSAICDGCGDDCEVPFRPTNGKPVYCRNCFRDNEGRGESRGGRGENQNSGVDNSKLMEQFSSLNNKLDRILKVLESNSSAKPAVKVSAKPAVAENLKVEELKTIKEAKESKPKKAKTAKKKVAKKK